MVFLNIWNQDSWKIIWFFQKVYDLGVPRYIDFLQYVPSRNDKDDLHYAHRKCLQNLTHIEYFCHNDSKQVQGGFVDVIWIFNWAAVNFIELHWIASLLIFYLFSLIFIDFLIVFYWAAMSFTEAHFHWCSMYFHRCSMLFYVFPI